MTNKDATKQPAVELNNAIQQSATGPMVFISHDGRDADFADAFSKLLKSVSAGMLKSFRSSDKKGTEGIEFGDEWFKRLMEKLKVASDVVCLFTERSLERPWILYEAGVARGTMQTAVLGIALGVPLSKVSTGPFYHFQNSDDTEDSLTKLVLQLAHRVPGLDPDTDVVRAQVKDFKTTEEKLLQKLAGKGVKQTQPPEENLMAKFLEEMKGLVRELPSRVAERVSEGGDPRRKRFRRFHPMIMDEIIHHAGEPGDPIGILILASMVRDDFPWFYEIALEAYHALKGGDHATVEREMTRIRHMSEMFMRGPFAEEMGISSREAHMFFMELPQIVEKLIRRCMEPKRPTRRRRAPIPEQT